MDINNLTEYEKAKVNELEQEMLKGPNTGISYISFLLIKIVELQLENDEIKAKVQDIRDFLVI